MFRGKSNLPWDEIRKDGKKRKKTTNCRSSIPMISKFVYKLWQVATVVWRDVINSDEEIYEVNLYIKLFRLYISNLEAVPTLARNL